MLLRTLAELDRAPTGSDDFSRWIEAHAHLEFLRTNAESEDVVIYAAGDCMFMHSVAVSNDRLSPIDQHDLMQWSFNPFRSIASYVISGGREEVRVERGLNGTGTKTLRNAVQLIFGRTFEGLTGPGSTYYELHQEYAHLAGIHWREEKQAYCRFNLLGDLESLVSVSNREDNGSDIALVSFNWKLLEEYLSASNASLVRMFDFTLLRRSEFTGWNGGAEQEVNETPEFFYRRRVMPSYAAYTRGVQIIRAHRTRDAILNGIKDGYFGSKDEQHCEFIAHDWRNSRVTKISTAPDATTNYFRAKENTLPYELSPAFFRPEVLLKYKGDRDKYTVRERDVSCRAAWHLEAIDINEAGQVHAYICYLSRLPHEEQMHWLSYNEAPKGGISERAVINDFRGRFVSFVHPLQRVLSALARWQDGKVSWWRLRHRSLIDRANAPVTTSRDEWAESFMDLAKLVIEGFEMGAIRGALEGAHVSYSDADKTIGLLEKYLRAVGGLNHGEKLNGLRAVQFYRTKLKGHASGDEAHELAQDALMKHETFYNHFQQVCAQVADELDKIQAHWA